MIGPPDFFKELSFNLIVAAAGGAITIGTVRIRKLWSDRKIEQTYPIAGEYISAFEDRTDGATVWVSAAATLHQAGKTLTGVTTAGDRCWVLDGKITDDNYVYGRYHAESRYDRGNGNFFLEICPEGRLQGLWSGFDSINGKIEAGAYTFRKVAPVSVVQLQQSLIPGAIRISQRQLGEAFLNESDLEDPDVIAFAALRNGKVVGFCAGRIVKSETFVASNPQIARTLPRQIFDNAENIGHLMSIAVEPALEGQGVGSRLIAALIARFDEGGVYVALLSGWKSPDGLHIGGVARRAGFEAVKEVPDYYKQGSLEHGYTCPVCGPPPCRCSAVIMMRTR